MSIIQRRRRQLMLFATALLPLAAGCQTIHYTTHQPGGGGRVEQNAPFFLWGLVGEKQVDLSTLCPRGTSRWYSQKTFLDGLLDVVTLGIYSPRTIVVECSNGAVYHAEPQGTGQYRVSLAETPRPTE